MSSKISYKGKNSNIKKRFSFIEGGHQLEKLEFALAVAQTKGVSNCDACSNEWLPLFGDEVLGSRFQDGHYAYSVVAGGGSGNDVFPPVLYVVDVENAVDFNSVLEP